MEIFDCFATSSFASDWRNRCRNRIFDNRRFCRKRYDDTDLDFENTWLSSAGISNETSLSATCFGVRDELFVTNRYGMFRSFSFLTNSHASSIFSVPLYIVPSRSIKLPTAHNSLPVSQPALAFCLYICSLITL